MRPISAHQKQIHADKLGVFNQQIKRRNGITIRFRDYIIDRLGVMAQKAKKMLLKIIRN